MLCETHSVRQAGRQAGEQVCWWCCSCCGIWLLFTLNVIFEQIWFIHLFIYLLFFLFVWERKDIHLSASHFLPNISNFLFLVVLLYFLSPLSVQIQIMMAGRFVEFSCGPSAVEALGVCMRELAHTLYSCEVLKRTDTVVGTSISNLVGFSYTLVYVAKILRFSCCCFMSENIHRTWISFLNEIPIASQLHVLVCWLVWIVFTHLQEQFHIFITFVWGEMDILQQFILIN